MSSSTPSTSGIGSADAANGSSTPSGLTGTTNYIQNPIGSTTLRGNNLLQSTPLRRADDTDADDLNQLVQTTDESLNPVEPAIDGSENTTPRSTDATGVRLGSFLLRPSVNQSINTERTKNASASSSRSYLATTVNGTLSSDWGRHALTITGEGTFDRTISGASSSSSSTSQPNGRLDADLRLDLSNSTVAHITGGYAYQKEDANDPNSVTGATSQASVNRFTGGASVERDFGVLRGTAAIAANRAVYGDVGLADGSRLSLSDRDRTAVEGRFRLGYELSQALIPFVELAVGRSLYDQEFDLSGYARSSYSYAARTGVQFDFSEKLRGELGLGYATVDYDDARLKTINAFTIDGNIAWSPQRGTNLDLGLKTTVQDSTTAGLSGWTEYQLTAGLSHQLLNDLTARLTGSTTLRDFSYQSNETGWQAGAGLIWNINRYFDATANVGYEHTENNGSASSNVWRAGLGLTLRR